MPYGFKSTQEQLADIREASELPVSCVHIDTCLGSFLQDHHNRDGECLFGVYVDGRMTVADVHQALIDEYRSSGDHIESGVATDEACKAAIEAAFEGADPAKIFDASLELPNVYEIGDAGEWSYDLPDGEQSGAICDTREEALDEAMEAHGDTGDESCQAWFLLTWDEPSKETDS